MQDFSSVKLRHVITFTNSEMWARSFLNKSRNFKPFEGLAALLSTYRKPEVFSGAFKKLLKILVNSSFSKRSKERLLISSTLFMPAAWKSGVSSWNNSSSFSKSKYLSLVPRNSRLSKFTKSKNLLSLVTPSLSCCMLHGNQYGGCVTLFTLISSYHPLSSLSNMGERLALNNVYKISTRPWILLRLLTLWVKSLLIFFGFRIRLFREFEI